jgi:hypothetical protein
MTQYGLLIERNSDHGTERIIARLVRREDNQDHPLGCNSRGESDIWSASSKPYHWSRQYDGLGMFGFVSDISNEFRYIGFEPEYRDAYAIDLRTATRMVKTLTVVQRAIAKAAAYEPCDQFAAMANGLRLDFVVEKKGNRLGSSYSDHEWRFMTIPEGRNRFRQLIAEAIAELQTRKVA